eukprot:m.220876 g.220876  ORF g.220876 m.220876 type:complete len:445 (-) comp19172_c1_seq7:294-1628(-)
MHSSTPHQLTSSIRERYISAEICDSNMAKKPLGPTLPAELSKELDDDDFYRLYRENAIQRNHGALSEENWEEEIEQIPLFMTKPPTQEQIDNNPDLQALQGIIEEDSTPISRATYCKDHANSIFSAAKKSTAIAKLKRIEYNKAIDLYDEGLKERDNIPKKLESILLSNKAAVNLALGNNRKVINDCTLAKELDPDNIKAYWRAATANKKLELYTEVISWCDEGLRVDPTNKTLSAERQAAVKIKAAADKKERQRAAQIRKKEKKDAELLDAFKARGIRFQKSIEVEMEVSRKGIAAAGGEVYVDSDKLLHWPVAFLYPEHQQTDFIKDYNEAHPFNLHLENMFAPTETIPWDAENKYKAGNLSLYFETQPSAAYKKTTLVKIDTRLSVHDALRDKRYTVVDLTPAFFVLVSGSTFEKHFLDMYKYSEGDAVDTSVLAERLAEM